MNDQSVSTNKYLNYMRTLKFVIVIVCGVLIAEIPERYTLGNGIMKIIDNMVGVWHLNKAYDGKSEVPITQQQEVISFIQFTKDNTYSFVTNMSKADSGHFRANEPRRLIYFESANRPSDQVAEEWGVTVRKDTLVLSKRDVTGLKRLRYVYVRQIHKEEE
jgi:hypothetical protein